MIWERPQHREISVPAVSYKVPSPQPDLWDSVPRRELMVIHDSPEGKCQAPLFPCVVPSYQEMNDKLTDFLNLGAPVIQELYVCLQKNLAV